MVTRSRFWLAFAFAGVLAAVLWFPSAGATVNPNFAPREKLMTLPQMTAEMAERIATLRPFVSLTDFAARLHVDPALLKTWSGRLDFDTSGADCCVR